MTFKIYLRPKANAKYTVFIQAIHNRKVKYIKNGFSLNSSQVNKNGEIKSKEIRNSLNNQIQIYEQKIAKLGARVNFMTCEELLEYIQREDKVEVQAERLDFYTFSYEYVEQLKKESFRRADMAMESLQVSFDGFINRDLEAVKKVTDNNEKVMKLGEKISDYLVQISARNTTLSDEKSVNALHSNVGDIARVAELADNLTKYTTREVRDNLIFSDGINEKISSMHDLLRKQYGLVKRIVLDNDYASLSESDEVEDQIDGMRRDLVAEHILRLGQGKCRPENNTVFINLVSNLERIGDHLNFIAHSTDNVK